MSDIFNTLQDAIQALTDHHLYGGDQAEVMEQVLDKLNEIENELERSL